jgi:hypothetical protein
MGNHTVTAIINSAALGDSSQYIQSFSVNIQATTVPLVVVTVIYENVTLVGVPTLFSFVPRLQNNVDGNFVQPADRKACLLLNKTITDASTCAQYGCVFNDSQCYLKPGNGEILYAHFSIHFKKFVLITQILNGARVGHKLF